MAIGDPLNARSDLYGRDSVDLLARTLLGETENDSESRAGVAWVVNNRKADTKYEFKNQNSVEAVVLATSAFSCFNPSDVNLQKCLKPNTSSAVWKNCVALAQNMGTNPIGDKLFYTQVDLFNNNSKTENGKLLYKMSGTWVVISSKILKGQHMFFNYEH
ncbi:hypothetical protein J2T13_003427 [Paenibacillus sp. DS2015]|uniref:cell wall hydrolase n=1 Tax=Paenibacillus sp. DS2015 TaxID=3373917 RepID=UPI003D229DA5